MRIFRTIISATKDGLVRFFSGTGLAGADDAIIDGEMVQQAGFASRPKQNDSGIIITQGSRVYLISSDNQADRPALAEGEKVFYFDQNNFIHFSVDGSGNLEKVYLKTTKKVEIEAIGEVIITGSAIKTTAATKLGFGLGVLLKLVNFLFITLYNSHTHPESGGGTTSPPNQQADATYTTINTEAT